MCTSLIQTYACEHTKAVCTTPCFAAKRRALEIRLALRDLGARSAHTPTSTPAYNTPTSSSSLSAIDPAQVDKVTYVNEAQLCPDLATHSTPQSRFVCFVCAGAQNPVDNEGSCEWWAARGWEAFAQAMTAKMEGRDWRDGRVAGIGGMQEGLERSGSLWSMALNGKSKE